MQFASNNLLYADIEIDGYVLPAYLDTGSSYAFVDGHAFEELRAH